MTEEDTSNIRDTARDQLLMERQQLELRDVMSETTKSLLEDCKSANNIKQKRMALAEIRKVKNQLNDDEAEIKKLKEFPVEELFDELVRLVEQQEAERTASEDTVSA